MGCNDCLNKLTNINLYKSLVKSVVEANGVYLYTCPNCKCVSYLKYDKQVNRIINLCNYKTDT